MDSKTRSRCRLDETASVIPAIEVGVRVPRQVMKVSYFAAAVEWLPGWKCSIEKPALRPIRCFVTSGGCSAPQTTEPERRHPSIGDDMLNVSALLTSTSVNRWTKFISSASCEV